MNPDTPLPVECGRCAPSTVTGARAKFTDTATGRRSHLKVFGHRPEYVADPRPQEHA